MRAYRKLSGQVVRAEQWWEGKDVAGVQVQTEAEAAIIFGGRRIPQAPQSYVVAQDGQRVFPDPGYWIVLERDGIHYTAWRDATFRANFKLVPNQEQECVA